ncbi:hypothetical protein B0H13DRAFT_1873658 [Mycena leptocephala]|nr:hypothetical protein B0H13DRAFT_1873658 [Mycena leptocephala]
MSVASVTWVHTLAEEHLEGTQESSEHEAPILPAPFAEDTYSDIEAEADPGQAVSQMARSMDESSKTTNPDTPTLLADNGEATEIATPLLKEYASTACKSDQREHNFLPNNLIPSLFSLVQSPNASAIAINAGFFGSFVLSLCRAVMSLQCTAWLDGYQVHWCHWDCDNMLKRYRHIAQIPATETPKMRCVRLVASDSMINIEPAPREPIAIFRVTPDVIQSTPEFGGGLYPL